MAAGYSGFVSLSIYGARSQDWPRLLSTVRLRGVLCGCSWRMRCRRTIRCSSVCSTLLRGFFALGHLLLRGPLGISCRWLLSTRIAGRRPVVAGRPSLTKRLGHGRSTGQYQGSEKSDLSRCHHQCLPLG